MRTIQDILTTSEDKVADAQCVSRLLQGITFRRSWSDDTTLTPAVKEKLQSALEECGIDDPSLIDTFLGQGNVYHIGTIPIPDIDDPSVDIEQQFAYAIAYIDDSTAASRVGPDTAPEVFSILLELCHDYATLPTWIASGLTQNPETPSHALALLALREDVNTFSQSLLMHANLDDEVALSLVQSVPEYADALASNHHLGSKVLQECLRVVTAKAATTNSSPLDWRSINLFRSMGPFICRHPNVTDEILSEMADLMCCHPETIDDRTFSSIVSSPAASTETLAKVMGACRQHGRSVESLPASLAILSAPNATDTMKAEAVELVERNLRRSYVSSYEVRQAADVLEKAPTVPVELWRAIMGSRWPELRSAVATSTPEGLFDELLEMAKPAALVAAFCQNKAFQAWLSQHPSAKTRARCVTLAIAAEDSIHYHPHITPDVTDFLESTDEVLRAAAVRTVDDPAELMKFASDPSSRVRTAAGRRLTKALAA